jgi:hypothetical protein
LPFPPCTEAPQDYLAHYVDITRYQWLFALSIGVFLALFLPRSRGIIQAGPCWPPDSIT